MCTEEKLINKAKMGDDQALKELFFLYKPLVNSILKKYYLHHYDRDDWEQEALIICYESVVVFLVKKEVLVVYIKLSYLIMLER